MLIEELIREPEPLKIALTLPLTTCITTVTDIQYVLPQAFNRQLAETIATHATKCRAVVTLSDYGIASPTNVGKALSAAGFYDGNDDGVVREIEATWGGTPAFVLLRDVETGNEAV